MEVSSKLAIDKRPSWPVAAVGLAGARIFQSQGGRTEETRAPGVEERGGAVYVGVRDSLSISSFLARCNVEVAAATSRVTHAYLQPLSRHSARRNLNSGPVVCGRPGFGFGSLLLFVSGVLFRHCAYVLLVADWGLSVNLKLPESTHEEANTKDVFGIVSEENSKKRLVRACQTS